MYVRKKKNKSGSYAIMLVQGERVSGKKNSISRTIKHFGSASEENELKKLIEQAEAYKQVLIQANPRAKVLKINSDSEINSCHSYNIGFSDVYGQLFTSAFSALSLKSNWFEKLRDVVVMRIAEPCSKRRTALISDEYGIDCQVDSLYKLMDQLTTPVIEEVKKNIYEKTVQLLEEKKQTIDVMFYDLTTLYFETNTQDEMRDFGFSKDGKHQHVQIMLAVIVTKEGLPIDYEEFPGNSYEGHTLIPVLQKIKERYKIDRTVIIADAALMNRINLEELNSQGFQYIMAARIKNTKKITQEVILKDDEYQTISQTDEDAIRTKTLRSDSGDNLFIYHSKKRARKDAYDREMALEKIKKHLQSSVKSKLTGCLKKSYVKINKACQIEIDAEKLALEAKYDGYFGLRSNIENADPMEVLSAYRGLWQVEQTFRISKNNLAIRPIFHYTPKRMRAHFVICYMALFLIRLVEFKLRIHNQYLPYEQWYLLLTRMRKVQIIDVNKNIFEILEDPPPEMSKAYKALGLPWYKKFQSKN